MENRKYAIYTALFCALFYLIPTISEFIFDHQTIYFLAIGDNRQLWLPAYMEGYEKFWNGGLFSSDLLTGGGSSIFGLRSNLSVIYPPFLLSYLLFDVSSVPVGSAVLGSLVLLHVFAAAYAAHRISSRMGLSEPLSFFVGFSFVTSITILTYFAFILFFIQSLIIPLNILAISKVLNKEKSSLVMSTAILISYALTGYPPMMAFGALVSVVVAIFLSDHPTKDIAKRLLLIAVAVAPALPLIAVYYIGQLSYFQTVPARFAGSSDYPGHALPFKSEDLGGSFFASMTGTAVEGRHFIGIFSAFIIALALSFSTDRRERRIIGVFSGFSLALYFLSLGTENWLSDAFFAIPVFGKMHLYQRYLIFSGITISLATAFSLNSIRKYFTDEYNLLVRKIISLAIVFPTFALALYFSSFSYREYMPIPSEIIAVGLAIFVTVNVTSDWTFAIVCSFLLSLTAPFANTLFPRLQDQVVAAAPLFNQRIRAGIDSVLFNGAGKLVRVLDLNTDADSPLPKNIGWIYKAGDRRAFTFHGYELHLNLEHAYNDMMGGGVWSL